MPVKLGELLLKEGMITPEQLQEGLEYQKLNGGKLGKALVSLGYVDKDEISGILSRQYGIPCIHLANFEVDPAIIAIVPQEAARKYLVLPLARSGVTLTLAMADPTDKLARDKILFMTGYETEAVVASQSSLEEAIEKYYGTGGRSESQDEGAIQVSEDEALVRYLSEEERQEPEMVKAFLKLYRLDRTGKIRIAMSGTREERAILARDPDSFVARLLMTNPSLTAAEIEAFAGMKNSSVEVLRHIGQHQDWNKRYPVVLNLVRNPRTPVPTSLRIVPQLMREDLTTLAQDENVPEAVRRQARKSLRGE